MCTSAARKFGPRSFRNVFALSLTAMVTKKALKYTWTKAKAIRLDGPQLGTKAVSVRCFSVFVLNLKSCARKLIRPKENSGFAPGSKSLFLCISGSRYNRQAQLVFCFSTTEYEQYEQRKKDSDQDVTCSAYNGRTSKRILYVINACFMYSCWTTFLGVLVTFMSSCLCLLAFFTRSSS